MKLDLFCDGASRGNPGSAAVAFVFFQDGSAVKKFSKKIGKTTNNVAEYQAVLTALEWFSQQKNLLGQSIDCYLDSLLVVNQLSGLYRIKDRKLQELAMRIKKNEKDFKIKIFYHHVRREKNKLADFLVNEVLDQFN